jgi:VCBS repeat-containing protein
MGQKHHAHWFTTSHSHHSDHHHHHEGHAYAFGTLFDDVLNGTEHRDVIFGLKGDDKIIGGDGNDWLDGGRGNDLLDGGPGHDKVFGGDGNDVAVFNAADNVGADAWGKDDYYDGGRGHDVLQLVLTSDEMANADIQADIDAFRAFLEHNAGGCGGHGKAFEFTSLDLVVRNFEGLDVESTDVPPAGNNAPPQATDDVAATLEDTPVTIDVLANDTDADGNPLMPVLVDGPAHGSLTLNADGTFTYTPEANYNNNYPDGADGFTYRASDGTDQSGVASVVINITPVNDAPQLKPDADRVGEFLHLQTTPNGILKIDINQYYDPSPPDALDELGQKVMLDYYDDSSSYGRVLGQLDDTTMIYQGPGGVPSNGHDLLAIGLTDDAGGFLGTDVQIDIVL